MHTNINVSTVITHSAIHTETTTLNQKLNIHFPTSKFALVVLVRRLKIYLFSFKRPVMWALFHGNPGEEYTAYVKEGKRSGPV